MNIQYIIDNSDGSLQGQNIYGSLSATTFYGDGSNLTGLGSVQTIDVQYSELYNLIITQSLNPNSTYRLTDYRSYNFIHGYDNAENNVNSINVFAGRLYKEFSDTIINENGTFNNNIWTVGINNDQSLIVGGEFTEFGINSRNRLIKLNSGGTEDVAFYTNLGTAFDNSIYVVKIQDDGKILVGGSFQSFNGNNNKQYLIRLNSDGTEDSDFYNNFYSAGGLNGTVRDIQIDNNGRIIVVGEFTSYNSSPRTSIIRLESGGTEDGSFYGTFISTGDNSGLNGSIFTVALDVNKDFIFLGGNFTSHNGVSSDRALKLDRFGLADSEFTTNIGNGFNGDILKIHTNIDPDINQHVFFVGTFTQFNGNNRSRIVKTDKTGVEDTNFYTNLTSFGNGSGFDGAVFTVTELTNNSIAIGGQFTSLNGQNNYYLVKLNSGGTLDNNFKTYNGFFQQVRYINQIDNDYILVGGDMMSYQDVQVSKILKLYNIETNSGYNAREINTGDTEVLLLKSISNYEFDPKVLSETYPSDVLEYLPYCNNLGFFFTVANGNSLPDSTIVENFDLQWDGTNVYFDMPSGYTVQYGHYFYLEASFIGQTNYNMECIFEPLTAVRSVPQFNDQNQQILINEILISSGGTRITIPDLTFENFQDYQNNTLLVETINPLHELRGWITKRTDLTRNVVTPIDFRGFKFRRYQSNLKQIYPNLNLSLNYYNLTDENYGIDGGLVTTGNYKDYNIFQQGQYPREIQMLGVGGPDGGYQKNGNSDNFVFLDSVQNSTIQEQFQNNTIFQNFSTNKIDGNFKNNILVNSFTDNKIGRSFFENVLLSFTNNNIGIFFNENAVGNNFNTNIIGDDFEVNNIADDFQLNFIGDNFNNNEIYFKFNNNQINNNFNDNSIYSEFRKNKILNDFNTNTIGSSANIGGSLFENNEIMNNFKGNLILSNFWSNRIKTDFEGNQIYQEFGYNNIGFGCAVNTFSGTTNQNTIADFFEFNTLQGSFSHNTIGVDFDSNQIGDGFGFGGAQYKGNIIGNHFHNNTIGEYFYDNFIRDNFTNNTVVDYFQQNTVTNDVTTIDFTTATTVYGYYNCNIFRRSDQALRLSYYDENDVLVITDITN